MAVLSNKGKGKLLYTEIVSTEVLEISLSTLGDSPIISITKGWQCCKCKETMYNDELNCTWNRCNHRRCSSCRSFIN